MSTISIQQAIGNGYNDGWFTNCQVRYRCFEGGRSTKKSVNIAGYEVIFKIMMDPNRNVLMTRKDDTSNTNTTYPNHSLKMLFVERSLQDELNHRFF